MSPFVVNQIVILDHLVINFKVIEIENVFLGFYYLTV